MGTFTFPQWVILFYIYCFIGWVIESTIVSVAQRKLINRGFLRLPMLPLYGSGAILILFVTLPVREYPVGVYFFGLLAATLLEYFTGWMMESLFKMRYWDYTKQKFNLHGRICLKASLFWGVLALFLTYVVQEPLGNFVIGIPRTVLLWIDFGITVLFLTDTVYSVRASIDLRKLLEKITRAKEELAKLHEELARLREELSDKTEDRLAEHRARLEERRARLEEHITQKKARIDALTGKLGFWKSQIIKGHPGMSSRRFSEALSDLQKKLAEKKH